MDFLQACAMNIITENNNKERRNSLRTFILRRKEKGEWVYKKVKWEDISHFYNKAKVGFEVLLGGNKIWTIIKILDKKKKRTQKTKVVTIFSEYSLPYGMPDYQKEIIKAIGKSGDVVFAHSRPGKNTAYEFMKHLKIDEKGNWIDPDPRGKKLYYDRDLVDHFMKMAYYKESIELRHKTDEKKKLKEFHKRPYFKTIIEDVKGKPRGKEDLKKISFPFYCEYRPEGLSYKQAGVIFQGLGKYTLYRINEQNVYQMNWVDDDRKLKGLMFKWDVEILKGELKLWREVDKKGESKKKEQ